MKLLTGLIVLLGLAGFFAFSSSLLPYGESDLEGTVHIHVIDASGTLVIEDVWPFSEGDTLFDMLERHYDVQWDDRTGAISGRVILGIDAITTDFEKDFLAILISGQIINRHGEAVAVERHFSSVGLDALPLLDGNTYIFEQRQVGPFGWGD